MYGRGLLQSCDARERGARGDARPRPTSRSTSTEGAQRIGGPEAFTVRRRQASEPGWTAGIGRLNSESSLRKALRAGAPLSRPLRLRQFSGSHTPRLKVGRDWLPALIARRSRSTVLGLRMRSPTRAAPVLVRRPESLALFCRLIRGMARSSWTGMPGSLGQIEAVLQQVEWSWSPMSNLIPRIAATLLSVAACAAQPTIGSIDFFAHTGVDIDALRSNLTIRPGNPWTSETNELVRLEIEELLGRAPSDVDAVCCDEAGNRMIYIGLSGGSRSRDRWNPQPTEPIELGTDLLTLYGRYEQAVEQAVSGGEGLILEDHSLGYPLSQDDGVREIQQRIRQYALSNSAQLFSVSRGSSLARHREIAIDAIGFGLHSADQIDALTHSALDPDRTVRNNAIRALSVLAASEVELEAQIPYATFVDLLSSEMRTDRSKAVFLLSELTESRDPGVLEAILRRALAPLVECARWSWSGHAYPARVVLGRIGGIDEATVLAEARNSAFVDVALDAIQRSRTR